MELRAEPAKPAPEPASTTESADGPPAAGANDMMASMRRTCPMVVEGISVAAADTDAGASLTFEIEAGDVTELRRRVQHMAQMYTAHAGHGGMMWHHMGGASGGGMHGGGMHGGMQGGGMMHGKAVPPGTGRRAFACSRRVGRAMSRSVCWSPRVGRHRRTPTA